MTGREGPERLLTPDGPPSLNHHQNSRLPTTLLQMTTDEGPNHLRTLSGSTKLPSNKDFGEGTTRYPQTHTRRTRPPLGRGLRPRRLTLGRPKILRSRGPEGTGPRRTIDNDSEPLHRQDPLPMTEPTEGQTSKGGSLERLLAVVQRRGSVTPFLENLLVPPLTTHLQTD